MKQYKQTELTLNILLLLFFTVLFIFTKSAEHMFIGYFTVGGIQLLSMLLHLIKGWFISPHSLRVIYYWVLVIIAFTIPLGFGIWILLYTAPLMALFYLFICYREWRVLKFKELVHLK